MKMLWGVVHSVFLPVFGIAQEPDASNFTCVKELNMPTYPAIARATMTEGDVTARIEIGDLGKVRSVTAVNPDISPMGRILAVTIENHVPFGKYDAQCSSKVVTLIFRFRIADVPKPKASYSFPNVFSLTARQEALQK